MAPGNLAISYYPTGEVRSVVSSDLSNNSKWTIAQIDSVEPSKLPDPIVVGEASPLGEAQAIVKTADGEIMLVASAPQAIPSVPTTSAVCPGFQPK